MKTPPTLIEASKKLLEETKATIPICKCVKWNEAPHGDHCPCVTLVAARKQLKEAIERAEKEPCAHFLTTRIEKLEEKITEWMGIDALEARMLRQLEIASKKAWAEVVPPYQIPPCAAEKEYAKVKHPSDLPGPAPTWEGDPFGWMAYVMSLPTFFENVWDQANQGTALKLKDVLREVLVELKRAQKKFPEWPTDPIHAVSIVAEELGDLQREINQVVYDKDGDSDVVTVNEGAVQLAAMSLQFLLSLGKYRFTPSQQHTL